jgi:hypothetical protein
MDIAGGSKTIKKLVHTLAYAIDQAFIAAAAQ